MRRQEALIRRIISETLLLEGALPVSILPPDVPPELFIGWMRRAYSVLPKPTGDLQSQFISVAQRGGLERNEAEALADFAITCLEQGKTMVFPFDIEAAPDAIIESLGYDRRRAGGIITRLQMELGERVLGNQFDGTLSSVFGAADSVLLLYHLIYEKSGLIQRDLAALRSVDSGELQRGIDTMDALYVFAQPKEIPKSTRRKLMGMVSSGLDGALQAAEIYSML